MTSNLQSAECPTTRESVADGLVTLSASCVGRMESTRIGRIACIESRTLKGDTSRVLESPLTPILDSMQVLPANLAIGTCLNPRYHNVGTRKSIPSGVGAIRANAGASVLDCEVSDAESKSGERYTRRDSAILRGNTGLGLPIAHRRTPKLAFSLAVFTTPNQAGWTCLNHENNTMDINIVAGTPTKRVLEPLESPDHVTITLSGSLVLLRKEKINNYGKKSFYYSTNAPAADETKVNGSGKLPAKTTSQLAKADNTRFQVTLPDGTVGDLEFSGTLFKLRAPKDAEAKAVADANRRAEEALAATIAVTNQKLDLVKMALSAGMDAETVAATSGMTLDAVNAIADSLTAPESEDNPEAN